MAEAARLSERTSGSGLAIPEAEEGGVLDAGVGAGGVTITFLFVTEAGAPALGGGAGSGGRIFLTSRLCVGSSDSSSSMSGMARLAPGTIRERPGPTRGWKIPVNVPHSCLRSRRASPYPANRSSCSRAASADGIRCAGSGASKPSRKASSVGGTSLVRLGIFPLITSRYILR